MDSDAEEQKEMTSMAKKQIALSGGILKEKPKDNVKMMSYMCVVYRLISISKYKTLKSECWISLRFTSRR